MRQFTNSFTVGESEHSNGGPLEGPELLRHGVNGALDLSIVHSARSLDYFKVAISREDHARIDRNAVPTNADAWLVNV